MTDMEIQLRGAMDDLAEDAPSAEGLLSAVHRRGRADRRRRLIVGAVAVLAAGVLGGTSIVAVAERSDEQQVQTLQVAMPAGSSRSAPPSPVSTGWLPKGFPEPTVRLLGPNAWGLDTRRDEGMAALQVQIMPAKPVVRTKPGTLLTLAQGGVEYSLYWVPTHAPGAPPYGNTPPEAEGPYGELIFERQPGQWIRIIVQNSAGDVDLGITQSDLIRIATGLRDEPRTLPDAIELGLLPGNVVWGQLKNEDYGVYAGFVDADAPARPVDQNEQPNGHNGSVASQVAVSVVPQDSLDISEFAPPLSPLPEEDPDGDGSFGTTRRPSPPVVAEDGSVYRRDGSTTVLYRLASNPKLLVVVRVKDGVMSGAELLKVARSVRLGPDAAVKPGR
ncbi:hypothetical protein [Cryptosporangium arvum]|uniref:Uncharacterized protein n=1 Tax=Cryptosporangium arvum DSM 44712 TaxID=927661 RepID=A0A011AIG6_9ACTN|nr:hypothetical protein [Cryptosporangium arvum]EXG81781.1 hypothetical protein CryarDRAFT_2901 [Cryptosporangium arvum DSM 44712]